MTCIGEEELYGVNEFATRVWIQVNKLDVDLIEDFENCFCHYSLLFFFHGLVNQSQAIIVLSLVQVFIGMCRREAEPNGQLADEGI